MNSDFSGLYWYLKNIRKIDIPYDPNYIPSIELIKLISIDVYSKIVNNTFQIPKCFFIKQAEIEQKLGLSDFQVYYSKKTNKHYLYLRFRSDNKHKQNIRDWIFSFVTQSRNKAYFDITDISIYTIVEQFNIQEICELGLEKVNIRCLKHGESFYSHNRNQLVKFYQGAFYNEWEEVVNLTIQEINELSHRVWERIHLDNIRAYFTTFYEVVVCSYSFSHYYRGEDSGALYPDYEEEVICQYNFRNAPEDLKLLILHIANKYNGKYVCGKTPEYNLILDCPEYCWDGKPTHSKTPKEYIRYSI